MSNNTPMAMAASAGERLQASARELMRNLRNFEDAMKKPDSKDGTSLENAFRVMFSSCTNGSDAMKSPAANDLNASQSALNSGSSSSSPKEQQQEARSPLPQKAEYGEHIYAQLFFDDQVRAAKAVSSLRDKEPKRTEPEKTSTRTPVSKPFPVTSSPVRNTKAKDASAPLSTDDLHIPANPTFDDEISAISANTLEAMVESTKAKITPKRSRSAESSIFPTSTNPSRSFSSSEVKRSSSLGQVRRSSSVGSAKRDTLGARRSPFSLPRSRSSQTWGSKNSGNQSTPTKGSRNSNSTRTTESSSFENMWQREEQKFWREEVQQETNVVVESRSRKAQPDVDKRRRSKSRDSSVRKSVQDNTLSTANSSTFSTWSSQFDKHPHETFHYEPSDIFARKASRDPDRISQVLVLSGSTEMAEI